MARFGTGHASASAAQRCVRSVELGMGRTAKDFFPEDALKLMNHHAKYLKIDYPIYSDAIQA